jgi:predicted MFS family arabinose efflux permease
MFSRRLKTGYFVLEGLNSFATVYFFYYLYYYVHKVHGFGNQANLLLAALNGATYALCAWWAGKFAQRFGYFRALKLGFFIMSVVAALGWGVKTASGQVGIMTLMVVGMSFTWPTLEALVAEGEPAGGVQHMVGIYNIVWAGTAAVANFFGGAMLDKLGPSSLFYVPLAIQVTQLGLTLLLESEANRSLAKSGGPIQTLPVPGPMAAAIAPLPGVHNPNPRTGEKAQRFLRMSWLANPFAYIALNTLIATMPAVAGRLRLSTTLAGFCGSVWSFARLGAFYGLWHWEGWHYRFRWLLLAYIGLVASFISILLAPNVIVLVSAQVVFGGALGLLYYSSLFYSMDLSDAKGEHGGIHEAVIGLGNFAGPALGAGALQFLPQYPSSSAVAVSLLLLSGLGGLAAIWRGGARSSRNAL